MGVVGNGGRLKDPDIFLDERLDHVPMRLYDKENFYYIRKATYRFTWNNWRTYKSQSKIESRMKIVDSLTFVWINFFLSNLHGYVNVPKQMIQHLGDSGLLLFSLPFFLFLS